MSSSHHISRIDFRILSCFLLSIFSVFPSYSSFWIIHVLAYWPLSGLLAIVPLDLLLDIFNKTLFLFQMSDTPPLPWTIKSVALFRIFSPPDPPPSPAGHLLLEVDDTGKAARSFRFKLTGTAHLNIDLPLSQILPLPTVAAFTAHYHLPPDFLQLRDSRFSTDWFDFTNEVDRGRISITHAGEDATTPYLEAVRTAAAADPSIGASLRWCVDGVDGEDLYLHLQHLPTALSNISGRPSFSRDTCPGTVIAAFRLDVDGWTVGRSMDRALSYSPMTRR